MSCLHQKLLPVASCILLPLFASVPWLRNAPGSLLNSKRVYYYFDIITYFNIIPPSPSLPLVCVSFSQKMFRINSPCAPWNTFDWLREEHSSRSESRAIDH